MFEDLFSPRYRILASAPTEGIGNMGTTMESSDRRPIPCTVTSDLQHLPQVSLQSITQETEGVEVTPVLSTTLPSEDLRNTCGHFPHSNNGNSDNNISEPRHTKDKPFICAECGKGFTLKEHLTRHKLTHTEERPFICAECGKGFTLKHHLTRHKLTHTEERPFICAKCSRSFTRNEHLTRHKLTHTEERPFICAECGKRFNQKHHLTKHRRTQHKR